MKSTDFALGALREGRRLCDVIVTRFTDGLPRHIQDEFPSDGRFRILVLTSTDSLDPQGISMPSPKELCTTIMPQFASGLLEPVILHLLSPHSFEWSDFPTIIKDVSEIRVHHANETAYTAYGVDPSSGALAVVRPDGYVGAIAKLEAVSRVDKHLSRCLVTIWILGR